MDGYFLYKVDNYYQVGEWFLGAIIFLYLLYPILVFLFKKNIFIVPGILVFGYLAMCLTNFFEIRDFRNLITCIFSFYMGFVVIKYKNFFFKNLVFGILSLVILLVLCFVKLPNFVLFQQIQGFCLFFVLVQIGNFVMKTKVSNFFYELGKLSFCIFLLQHQIISIVQRFYNPEQWYKILIMLLSIIITTVLCAKLLSSFVNLLLNTKFIKKMESKFLSSVIPVV